MQTFIKKLQQSINHLLSKVNTLNDDINNLKNNASNLPADSESTEPYQRDVLIYPRQVVGSFGNNLLQNSITVLNLSTASNHACPFWVKQKVNITRFKVSISSGTGSLCIYKYTSEVDPLNPFTGLNFTLVNQAPVTTFPTQGYQQIILSTPITLEPNNIYVAVIIPTTTLSVSGIKSLSNTAPQTVFDANNFLGISTQLSQRLVGMNLQSGNGVLVGDVAPTTLRFIPNQPQAQLVEYLQLGLFNT